MTGKVIGHRSRDQGMRFFGVGSAAAGWGLGSGACSNLIFCIRLFQEIN